MAGAYTRSPVVRWAGPDDAERLVVLLHGHGGDERAVDALVAVAPLAARVAVLRGPLAAEDGGRTWFEAGGPGRPRPTSLERTVAWLVAWLDSLGPAGRRPIVVGYSAGGAAAAALALAHPGRVSGLGIVHASVPRLATTVPGRLAGVPVLVVHGARDRTLPAEVLDGAWRYLHDWSGADVVGLRHDGGHELTARGLAAVQDWLASSGRDGAEAVPTPIGTRSEPSWSHGRVHGPRG